MNPSIPARTWLKSLVTKCARRTELMPKPQRTVLIASVCMAALHTVADYIYFDLKTIQGHIYVTLMEIFLQVAIYAIATSKTAGATRVPAGRSMAVLSLANMLAAGYKALFVVTLAGTPVVSDFTAIFPFASGGAYSLAAVGDGSSDAIANALYQCGMCVSRSRIPLNDPFISYLFVAISFTAGEFNQHILWLTLEVMNFFTAVVLLKTVLTFFPSTQHPWMVPVAYILLFEVHGVTQQLFKDGLIAFASIWLFHTYSRYVGKSKTGPLVELLAVVLIVFIYNLRNGTLVLIFCLSLLNCVFDSKRWLIHSRILLGGLVAIILLGNVDGFSNNLEYSSTRSRDKITQGASAHLDTHNLTYSTTREESLFRKLNLDDVTWSNFFYAPVVKGSLYFLLPLPVGQFVDRADFFHKMSTMIYYILFLLLLVGIVSILKNRKRAELYLLATFGLFVLLILGAGPMLLPRYRIMALPFFLLIVMLGASQISNRLIGLSLSVSILALAGVVTWYAELYALIQSVV